MTENPITPEVFWQQTEAELSEWNPDVAVEVDSFYSQPEWDVYRMYYTSAGGQRLFAWFSAPRGDGPYPALVRMPDYASVHDIIYTPLRHRAVVMNPTYRGQRHSDGMVRASYPGLLTEGIEDVRSCVVVGAFADALRALDVLEAQQVAQIGTVALTGAGLGAGLSLAAAARRPRVSAVAADTPMPLGNRAALEPGLGYPLAELGDYLRLYPDRRSQVEATLSVLDPLHVAASVRAPVLLSAGRFDRSTCPLAFSGELAAVLAQLRFQALRRRSRGRRPRTRPDTGRLARRNAGVELKWPGFYTDDPSTGSGRTGERTCIYMDGQDFWALCVTGLPRCGPSGNDGWRPFDRIRMSGGITLHV